MPNDAATESPIVPNVDDDTGESLHPADPWPPVQTRYEHSAYSIYVELISSLSQLTGGHRHSAHRTKIVKTLVLVIIIVRNFFFLSLFFRDRAKLRNVFLPLSSVWLNFGYCYFLISLGLIFLGLFIEKSAGREVQLRLIGGPSCFR